MNIYALFGPQFEYNDNTYDLYGPGDLTGTYRDESAALQALESLIAAMSGWNPNDFELETEADLNAALREYSRVVELAVEGASGDESTVWAVGLPSEDDSVSCDRIVSVHADPRTAAEVVRQEMAEEYARDGSDEDFAPTLLRAIPIEIGDAQ